MSEDEKRSSQQRANYRRRLHTIFDDMLDKANVADPQIRDDAFELAGAMVAEMRAAGEDLTMPLFQLQALRRSIEHHQRVLDTMAIVLYEGVESWTTIGDALGISAQAANKRLSRKEPSDFELEALDRYLRRQRAAMRRMGVETD